MKKWVLYLFSLVICFVWLSQDAESQQGYRSKGAPAISGAEQTSVYASMPGPGKQVAIGSDYYLIYGFDRKPKLGTLIMKVEIFTKEGKKDTSFEAKADTDMPSMRGAHATGDRTFKLSNKGDYLLPIDIVMPGVWEIKLTVLKEGKVIFRGSHQFDV